MDVIQHFVISHFGGFINDLRSLIETIQKHYYLTDVDKEVLFICLYKDMYEKPIKGQYRTESFLKQKFADDAVICKEMAMELDGIKLNNYVRKTFNVDYFSKDISTPPKGSFLVPLYTPVPNFMPEEYSGYVLRCMSSAMSLDFKKSQPAPEVNHNNKSNTKCCDPKPHKKNE